MSEGMLKPEKDFSKEADEQIPEAEKLAQVIDFEASYEVHHD
jgi:26S proteasome regulatory subunit N5